MGSELIAANTAHGDFWASVNFKDEKISDFNPKRPGLLGLPNTRGGGGGAESAHFGKRSLTPPNFILEQQTESHMKADIFF